MAQSGRFDLVRKISGSVEPGGVQRRRLWVMDLLSKWRGPSGWRNSAAPYRRFKAACYDIALASPAGGRPPLDPKSNEPGFRTDDTHWFEADTEASATLADTVRLDSVPARATAAGITLESTPSRRSTMPWQPVSSVSSLVTASHGSSPCSTRPPGRVQVDSPSRDLWQARSTRPSVTHTAYAASRKLISGIYYRAHRGRAAPRPCRSRSLRCCHGIRDNSGAVWARRLCT